MPELPNTGQVPRSFVADNGSEADAVAHGSLHGLAVQVLILLRLVPPLVERFQVGFDVVTLLVASFYEAVMPRVQCQLWPVSPRRQYRQEAGYPYGVEDTQRNAMPSASRFSSSDLHGSRGAGASHGGGCG